MEVNCVNEKIKKDMAEILEKYTEQKDNLIAILNEVQEKYGYIPQKAQLEISEKHLEAIRVFCLFCLIDKMFNELNVRSCKTP